MLRSRTAFVVVALNACLQGAILLAGCPTPPGDETGEGEGEPGEEGEGEGEGEAGEGEGEGEEGEGEGGEGEVEVGGEGVFVVETCAGAPAGGGVDVCAVTAGSGGTIVFGTILTSGRVFEGGAVAFGDDGVINCVGCGCAAAPEAVGFTKIACGDAVVSPGLINAHDHAGWMNAEPWYATPANDDISDDLRWEQRHDWRKGKRSHPSINAPGSANNDAKALGEFRFSLSGATATLASGGFSFAAGGVIRNLDAAADATALGVQRVNYVTFPLGDSNGAQLASGCAYPEIADKPNGPNAPHIAEGVDVQARNEFLCLSSSGGGAKDTIDANSAIIHGVGLTPVDVAIMAERGASLIWSPRSNISLYGETAPVTLMKNMGVNIALGTDWLPSGSMNMARELRCAAELNANNYGDTFSQQDLWRMTTVNAARALHADDAIGSLQVGRRADIAIFSAGSGPFSSVTAAGPEDVVLVLKDGRALNGNGAVVNALESGCDVLDVCGSEKRVCATREAGKGLAALQAAQNGVRYQLVSCDNELPADEPTCVPSRTQTVDAIDGSTLYTGVASATDDDGDGVLNDADNCRFVFNPIRPVDDGAQANDDADDDGDACDPCPLDADTNNCTGFNPDDRDGDGVNVPADNCPDDANTQQEDGDTDGIGDACDVCPQDATAPGEGCPFSIYDVKTNLALSTPPSTVTIDNMVVTAVATNGFFSQLDPTDADFVGVANSCVFTFMGNAEKPVVGQKVKIAATAQTFFDQIQLSSATFTDRGTGSVIAPTVLADAAAVAAALTAGPRAPLEGCLVDVRNVVVSDPVPAAGGGDAGDPRNEFAIEGGLRVDDSLFLLSPQPDTVGQTYVALKGVLAWRNSLMKLLPRDATDVAEGPVAVAAVEGGFVRVATSSTGVGGTIRVRLTRAADVATDIDLSSSDTAVFTVPATATVQPGDFTVDVVVTGVAVGTANLSASLDGGTPALAPVTVLAADAPASVVTAAPTTVTLQVGQTADVVLSLDIPAPAGGADIALASDSASVTVAATADVPADARAVVVTLTAVSIGTSTVTATLGGGSVDIEVTVEEVPAEVDLSGFQLVRNDNNTTFTLPANTIVPIGGSVVIGREAAKAAFETFWQVTLGADVTYLVATPNFVVINATPRSYSLRRDATTVVDGPTIGASAGNTIQRLTPVEDSSLAASWTVLGAADEATPGSGQANSPAAPSGCYISEISDAVGNSAFANEFIELHCTGALP